MEYMKAKHPFIDRNRLVIVGDHVTLESGTGCVHTAPGHGVDDYNVCKNNYPELPIIVPVDNHGKMTAEAGEQFAGLSTDEASRAIAKTFGRDWRNVCCIRESFTNIRTAGVVKILYYSVRQSNGSVLWMILKSKQSKQFKMLLGFPAGAKTALHLWCKIEMTGVFPVSADGACRFLFSIAKNAVNA